MFTRRTHTAISYTSSNVLHQAHSPETELSQPHQSVPGPSRQRPLITAGTDFTRPTNVSISYTRSRSPPKAHQYESKLYQLQVLQRPSITRQFEPTEERICIPLDTSATHTRDRNLYQDSNNINRSYQQDQSSQETSRNHPILLLARSPCDIATSNIHYDRPHQGRHYGSLLLEQQPSLPRPSVPGPNVPAVTSDTTNTSGSGRHSSGTDSGLTLLSLLALPAARPTQPSTVPPARPEQQEIHVAPSQVSNISRLVILHIIVTYMHLLLIRKERIIRIYQYILQQINSISLYLCTSYPMRTGGTSPEAKVAGAWNWALTSN
jgi:hypothetical protein